MGRRLEPFSELTKGIIRERLNPGLSAIDNEVNSHLSGMIKAREMLPFTCGLKDPHGRRIVLAKVVSPSTMLLAGRGWNDADVLETQAVDGLEGQIDGGRNQ